METLAATVSDDPYIFFMHENEKRGLQEGFTRVDVVNDQRPL